MNAGESGKKGAIKRFKKIEFNPIKSKPILISTMANKITGNMNTQDKFLRKTSRGNN